MSTSTPFPTATLPEIVGPEGLFTDGDWVESVDQDPEGSVRLTQLADVGDGEFRNRSDRWMNDEQADRLRVTYLRPGDVLIARMPDPLGRACVCPPLTTRAVTVVDVCIVRAPGHNPKWLMHMINSPQLRVCIAGMQAGSTRKRISKGNLATVGVPAPPRTVQDRIVAAIETHFSRLDAAVAALTRAKANVKRARASVLKAAVEGRLVPTEAALARAEGRAYEPASVLLERILAERKAAWTASGARGKYQEPVKPDTEGLAELPEGWAYCRIDTAGLVQLGRQRAPKNHDGPNMRPYLRVANVFEARIDLSDVMEMNFTPEEFEVFRLEPGDILLNEGQSPHLVGRPAMWNGERPGMCFTNTLVRFKAGTGVTPSYALAVFRVQLAARRYMKLVTITTNIAHLGAQRFAAVEFPLPPLAEQHRIVAEVDRRLSVLDALARSIDLNLARCARLRQAVLKRAFEGRLVQTELPVEAAPTHPASVAP